MPGSPIQVFIAKYRGRLSPAAVHAIAALFQLGNRNLFSAYLGYWQNLFRGNLGVSLTFFPSSVASVVRSAIWWTLGLVGVSIVISFALGTLLGVLVAWKRGSWLDSLIPATTFFTAVPYFWLGLVLLYLFAQTWNIFPNAGAYAPTVNPGLSLSFISSVIYYGLLPMLTLVISSIAGWLIQMRNMMVVTLDEDYVLMAEAKGLSRRRVMFAYAARNAVLPSVASFALSLGFVVSGALLTEVVFSYPGIGYTLYQAVVNEDYPLMQGIFLIITLSVLAVNFVVDIFYGLLDPRTRQVAGAR